MRADPHDLDLCVRVDSPCLRHLGADPACGRPGLDQRREQRRRDPQPVTQLTRPRARDGVVETRRRRVRPLRALHPGHQVAQKIGQQQHPLGLGPEHIRRFGEQLVDGVERLVLQAGDPVVRGTPDDRTGRLEHALGARIAVAGRVGQESSAGIEQAVIDSPRIDSHRRRTVLEHRDPDTGTDLTPQRREIPPPDTVDLVGRVGEPRHFGEVEPIRGDAPDHDTPGRRPEVDRSGGDLRVCPNEAHRRKAAATPESTGTCRPVVWDRSPDTSATTAAATCSGRTSCLSRVRCA